MTVWKSVGRSRYKGDTNGVEQFLQEHAASRILDLIEIVARQPGCRRMTVNEGRRTRPRQDDLWRRWKNGTGYLAAVPYTSRHDEVRHGNAADLGGPDGEALNLAERAAISRFGPGIGVDFAGLRFSPPEPWHVEADETPYTRRYGSTTPASASPAKVIEPITETDMYILQAPSDDKRPREITSLLISENFGDMLTSEAFQFFSAIPGVPVRSGTQRAWDLAMATKKLRSPYGVPLPANRKLQA